MDQLGLMTPITKRSRERDRSGGSAGAARRDPRGDPSRTSRAGLPSSCRPTCCARRPSNPETWPTPGEPARGGAEDVTSSGRPPARRMPSARSWWPAAASTGPRHGTKLRSLAGQRIGAPAITSHAARGVLPFAHPQHVPAARSRALRDADVVLVAGSRLNFMLAYGQPPRFNAEAQIVQIDVDPFRDRPQPPRYLGLDRRRPYRARQLVDRLDERSPGAWLGALRKTTQRTGRSRGRGGDGRNADPSAAALPGAHPRTAGGCLRGRGQEATSSRSPGRPSRCRRPAAGSTRAPSADSVYRIASACAAKLARPDRPAVALLGDGALGLQAMELDTASRHGLGILVVVSTNGSWAIEATSQEMEFGRAVATALQRRPYHVLAEALGCDGIEVTRPEELATALSCRPRTGRSS